MTQEVLLRDSGSSRVLANGWMDKFALGRSEAMGMSEQNATTAGGGNWKRRFFVLTVSFPKPDEGEEEKQQSEEAAPPPALDATANLDDVDAHAKEGTTATSAETANTADESVPKTEKRSSKNDGIVRLRYYKNRVQTNLLEDQEKEKVLGTVDVSQCTTVSECSQHTHPEFRHKHRDLCLVWFEGHQQERKLLMRCRDPEDHDHWCLALLRITDREAAVAFASAKKERESKPKSRSVSPAAKPPRTPSPQPQQQSQGQQQVDERKETTTAAVDQKKKEDESPTRESNYRAVVLAHHEGDEDDEEFDESHPLPELSLEENDVLLAANQQCQARRGLSLLDGEALFCHICGVGVPKALFSSHNECCEVDLRDATKALSLDPLFGLVHAPTPITLRRLLAKNRIDNNDNGGAYEGDRSRSYDHLAGAADPTAWSVALCCRYNAFAVREFASHYVCCRGCTSKVPLHLAFEHSSDDCTREYTTVQNCPIKIRMRKPGEPKPPITGINISR